jgi:hypothetical protein
MNTSNRKIRPQPALASLTDDEREQIADWLRTQTFVQVQSRIAKSREDGGFRLKVSISTLQRLRDRTATLQQINDELEDKQNLADLLAAQNGEKVDWAKGTYELVQRAAFKVALLPDQTPARLGSLLRLADHPRVVANDEHKKQIAERNTALREGQLTLSREKHELRRTTSSPSPLQGDHNSRSERLVEGNKLVAGQTAKRFVIPAVQTLGSHWAGVRGAPNINQTSFSSFPSVKQNPDNPLNPENPVQNPSSENSEFLIPNSELMSRPCDHLGPLARNWEDVRARARKAFGITPEESARRAELRRTWKPPEIIEPQPIPSANETIPLQQLAENAALVSESTAQVGPDVSAQHASVDQFTLPSGPSSENSTRTKPLNLVDLLTDLVPKSSTGNGGSSSRSSFPTTSAAPNTAIHGSTDDPARSETAA